MTSTAVPAFAITIEQQADLERCGRTQLYKMLREQGIVDAFYAPFDNGLVRSAYKKSAQRSATVKISNAHGNEISDDATPTHDDVETVTCTSLEALLARVVPTTMQRQLPGFSFKDMHELCVYGAYVDFLPSDVPLMEASWTVKAIKAAKALNMTPEQVARKYAEWHAADVGEYRERWDRFSEHMQFNLPAKRKRAVEPEHIKEAMQEVKAMLQTNPGKKVRLVLEGDPEQNAMDTTESA